VVAFSGRIDSLSGTSKRFVRHNSLPAAVVDDVPADHLAQFVLASARERLLSEIVASHKSVLGQPRVPTSTLIGRFSSIRRACSNDTVRSSRSSTQV
jgi:hypothetical protein